MSARLLTSQRNEVLRLVEKAGFDPALFGWKDTPSAFQESAGATPTLVPMLVYRETVFYFVFDLKSGKHFSIFSPGAETAQEMQYPGSWRLQLQYFGEWLSHVSRETRQDDLWERFAAAASGIGGLSVELADTPFSGRDIDQVSNKLDAIATRVDLIAGTSEGIAVEISYLKEELGRQSKRDWFFMFVGVLATIGTALALTPEQGTAVLTYLREMIGRIHGLLRPTR